MRRSMWSIGVATLAGGCVSQARFVDLDQRYDQVVASRDQALAERDKAREEVGQVTTALEAADRRIQAAHERLRGWAEERSWEMSLERDRARLRAMHTEDCSSGTAVLGDASLEGMGELGALGGWWVVSVVVDPEAPCGGDLQPTASAEIVAARLVEAGVPAQRVVVGAFLADQETLLDSASDATAGGVYVDWVWGTLGTDGGHAEGNRLESPDGPQ